MGFLNDLSQGGAKAAAQANAPGGAGGLLEDEFDKSFGASLIPKYGDEPLDIARPEIMQDNVFQRLMGAPDQQAPQERSSGRRSVLDVIGRLADTVANVAGTDPLYQTGLARERQRRQEETAQGWQEKFNQQKFASGENELSETELSRSAQAARGLAAVFQQGGAPAVTRALPMIARHLGLSPEQSELWARSLADDPEGTISALTAATSAPNSASQPSQVQLYNLMLKEDPALASAYLKRLADPEAELTPYQEEQLALRRETLDYRRTNDRLNRKERRDRPARTGAAGGAKAEQQRQSQAATAQGATTVIAEMRDAYNRLRNAGGINARGQTAVERGKALAQENVPLVERLSNPEGFSARQDLDRLRTTGISSLLPLLGGLSIGGKNIDAAKELDTWRKAIASASDYESAMRALDGFERRIQQITAEQSAAPAASPRRTLTPRPRRSAPPSGGNGGWKIIGVT